MEVYHLTLFLSHVVVTMPMAPHPFSPHEQMWDTVVKMYRVVKFTTILAAD